MKIARKIFVLVCGLGVIFSINAASKLEVNTHKTTEKAGLSELNAIIETAELDACYDDMMSTWLAAFNALQEKGLSSEAADNLASMEAVEAYEACR